MRRLPFKIKKYVSPIFYYLVAWACNYTDHGFPGRFAPMKGVSKD